MVVDVFFCSIVRVDIINKRIFPLFVYLNQLVIRIHVLF